MDSRNAVWVMLIPGVVGAYGVTIYRTFFKSVPNLLCDVAYIDDAGHYWVLAQIMVLVSKTLFAAFVCIVSTGGQVQRFVHTGFNFY